MTVQSLNCVHNLLLPKFFHEQDAIYKPLYVLNTFSNGSTIVYLTTRQVKKLTKIAYVCEKLIETKF